MTRVAASLIVLLSLPALCAAQDSARSALVGRTTDATGGALRGARVKATARATGVVSEASTDARGYYTLPSLAPGAYDVAVEAPGFTAAAFANVRLEVGRTRQLDASLAVGGQTETVDVEDAANRGRRAQLRGGRGRLAPAPSSTCP